MWCVMENHLKALGVMNAKQHLGKATSPQHPYFMLCKILSQATAS